MSFLTEGYPTGADGFELHTDFRIWLDFERDVGSVNTCSDLIAVVEKYFKSPPPQNPEAAISVLMKFYSAENMSRKERRASGIMPRAYDFEIDASPIYSAFIAQYGIDLYTANLHWHAFIHLFYGLTEEHKITKLMQFRTVNTENIKDKEQKKFYKKMKNTYRLPALKPEFLDDQIGEVFAGI